MQIYARRQFHDGDLSVVAIAEGFLMWYAHVLRTLYIGQAMCVYIKINLCINFLNVWWPMQLDSLGGLMISFKFQRLSIKIYEILL